MNLTKFSYSYLAPLCLCVYVAAERVAALLQVSECDLTIALLRPRIKVGHEYVTKAQTRAQVEFLVEAIS